MRRRRVLALVATAPLVAGCSTVLPSESGGVLDSRESPQHDKLLSKPLPPAEEPLDATEDTVAVLQYPGKPTSYTSQPVQSFVENHERAYRRNEVLGRNGGDLVAHRFDFDWTVALDASEKAGVGRCQYSYTTTERSDSDDAGPVVGDSPTYVVTYYVDDSMTVRAEGTGPTERQDELSPDPWESGVVLEPAD